ncbi:MAG TPA: ABC transporter ATP-binding protein [Acetobacteraceae bacterium]|jgi:putative spermidine/putrescine transport system ATP-binding protein|nr:ABC transporter ATP-binding protein [Acetobacteraceae bacterium]
MDGDSGLGAGMGNARHRDAAASLTLDALSARFGAQLAVDRISLSVAPGEMIVLLGPSGCGKTTTLRMIAGFVAASGGDVRVNGTSVLALPPYRREMGIVFQSYALFPHLSVARNVAFGLEMRRMRSGEIAARVAEMLRLVKLETFAERLPRQLSGGQQQRVALARALAIHPKVLLLDEPLSNLDASLRLEMAREIRMLQREGGITTLMVTHDQAEAMAMADRLVVMREGRVEQIGRQEDLYQRPATPFVARFIGQSNILVGRITNGQRLAIEGGHDIAFAGRYGADGAGTLAIRPESIRIGPAGAADAQTEGTVELCTYLGAVVEHLVRIDSGQDLLVRGPGLGSDAAPRAAAGSRVSLHWPAAEERLFDDHDHALAPVAGAFAESAAE